MSEVSMYLDSSVAVRGEDGVDHRRLSGCMDEHPTLSTPLPRLLLSPRKALRWGISEVNVEGSCQLWS